MARIASTVLVVALLAATAAAFALTQGLKLQKSPIFGTRVQPVFSPVCDCPKETARIAFKLRKADRLDIAIVDGGKVVRTIERGGAIRVGLSLYLYYQVPHKVYLLQDYNLSDANPPI